jgi:Ala-tRNA(Pro) deacylase
MSIAHTVRMYLEGRGVPYEVIAHKRSATSLRAAETAHIEAERLAKAVLFEDDLEHDRYVVAVLPATQRVRVPELAIAVGRPVHVAGEEDASALFGDCEPGAIPALGPAYGVETVIEDSVLEQPDLYFEAGDHEHLVHLKTRDFAALLADCRHGRFGESPENTAAG